MYYQNALHRVRFFCNLLPTFYKYVFELYRNIGYIVGQGQTIKHFTFDSMKSLVFPLPSLSEQQRILDKLKEIIPIVVQYGIQQDSLSLLNQDIKTNLQKSILQEAIQGRLVPQIPQEGTAQDLLEQIQLEKQTLVADGKLKKSAINDSVIYKADDNKYYERKDNEVVEITELIPYEIPSTWSWCRLNELCSIMSGATFKKEETNRSGNGIRILRGGNISPYRIEIKSDDLFISEDKVVENILLRKNDIITPAVTSLENIGKMALVKSNMPYVTVGGFVFIVRCYMPLDIVSRYLLLALSAPTTIEYIKSITNKSGQAFYNIGKERLLTTLIPMPPLLEQQRIVAKIDTLFESLK